MRWWARQGNQKSLRRVDKSGHNELSRIYGYEISDEKYEMRNIRWWAGQENQKSLRLGGGKYENLGKVIKMRKS